MIGLSCGFADLPVLMEFDCFSSIAKLDKTASSCTVLPRLFRFHSVVVSVLAQFWFSFVSVNTVTAGDWLCHMSHQSWLHDTF